MKGTDVTAISTDGSASGRYSYTGLFDMVAVGPTVGVRVGGAGVAVLPSSLSSGRQYPDGSHVSGSGSSGNVAATKPSSNSPSYSSAGDEIGELNAIEPDVKYSAAKIVTTNVAITRFISPIPFYRRYLYSTNLLTAYIISQIGNVVNAPM